MTMCRATHSGSKFMVQPFYSNLKLILIWLFLEFVGSVTNTSVAQMRDLPLHIQMQSISLSNRRSSMMSALNNSRNSTMSSSSNSRSSTMSVSSDSCISVISALVSKNRDTTDDLKRGNNFEPHNNVTIPRNGIQLPLPKPK